MSQENLNHADCQNFVPVDVAKGLCMVHSKEVLIDSQICPKFETLPKCKNCVRFTDVNDKAIGACQGFKDQYWTYADLKAVHCEMYSAK